MLDEKDLFEKLVKLKDNIGDKKIKNSIKEQINVFDSLKGILEASNVERMKLPMEFENNKNYMEYIREYIKKYSKDITKYSNKILMLNERIQINGNEDDLIELYGLLMGFVSFLMIKDFLIEK